MNTPKEEAQDIYDKMKGFRVKYSHAKKCARVCVDKLIVLNGDLWLKGKLDKEEYQKTNGYLFSVKEELEKL